MHPHFSNSWWSLATVPYWPWPSAHCLPHMSHVEVWQIGVCWNTLVLFNSLPSYYPHISQIFPKLSRLLQQLKHFSHSVLLSSLFFWQNLPTCRSDRLSVPQPKLTQPIGESNHDLTNKKNWGLQQGGCLGLEEQWKSHRVCHCFSTTDHFWQSSCLFFSKPKEQSHSTKSLIKET